MEDARSGSRVAMLVPSSDPTCQLSEEAGKWVKSVALAEDKDYLVRGVCYRSSLLFLFKIFNSFQNNSFLVHNPSISMKTNNLIIQNLK